mmetsp:Transcript_34899/g.35084  ORF Transcript_34899/g.35084 Transcript_34899/m.35084 type:complete len:179 (+) Transcript_34899:79-615(+)
MASYLSTIQDLQATDGRFSLPIHSTEAGTNPNVSVNFGNKNPAGDDSIDHGVTKAPYECAFSPYEFNGGTTIAISGEDWALVAADTRLSSGYEILSRNTTKLHPLTDGCVLGSAGCKTDVDQLRSVLDIKMKVWDNIVVINFFTLYFFLMFLNLAVRRSCHQQQQRCNRFTAIIIERK